MTTARSVAVEVSERGGLPLRQRVAPAVIGLLYPALVWSVHAVSPFALLLTLLAPAACLYLAFQLATGNRYRVATRVAYFGVGAPALYTFLGGWLDSQKWLPFGADGVWVVQWCGLVITTLIERPRCDRECQCSPGETGFRSWRGGGVHHHVCGVSSVESFGGSVRWRGAHCGDGTFASGVPAAAS